MAAFQSTISRYEYKYLVPASLAEEILRHVRPFVRPDRHSPGDGGYSISSLYLDSPDLRLLQMGLEGWSERFKLRARCYGDGPDDPVFLEVKRRRVGIVQKQRTRIERSQAVALLDGGTSSRARLAADPGLGSFGALCETHDARPVLRVRYRRCAFEALSGAPLRITFDSRIEFADGRDGRVSLHEGTWRKLPLGGIVFEVKFNDRYPAWVRDLVMTFQLDRRSISKYSLAMSRALSEGRQWVRHVPGIPGVRA